MNMNWSEIQGNWNQLTGAIKERWGKLTDNDIKVIAGKKDQLMGALQEKYGMLKEELESQIDAFTHDVKSKGSKKTTASVSVKSGSKSLKSKVSLKNKR